MSENKEPVSGQTIAESKVVKRTTLELWNRNPRSIKTERFNELKERLNRQGQIKPLLVAKDGKTVIGGNMRLRAMEELGINDVWVSQTEAVKRTCYMMELDPKYCDVIRKRYAKHIGEEDNWEDATPVISEAKELEHASR